VGAEVCLEIRSQNFEHVRRHGTSEYVGIMRSIKQRRQRAAIRLGEQLLQSIGQVVDGQIARKDNWEIPRVRIGWIGQNTFDRHAPKVVSTRARCGSGYVELIGVKRLQLAMR